MEGNNMFYEIIAIGLMLLISGCVIAMFFCSVELAPRVARKTAESARFAGLKTRAKMVRFW